MISAIVCVDKNWGIGSNGDLLVHIPEDMKFFKEKTINNVVIMGRKTYDSIPVKPLPNRTNIVITSNEYEFEDSENIFFVSMEFAKAFLSTIIPKSPIKYFVIGGGQIYKELLPYCEKVYVTKVNYTYENVDTYFPNIDNISKWEIESVSETKEHNGAEYQFYTYRKKDVEQ